MRNVTLYTTPSCGFCRAALALFHKKGIEVTNIDVARDPETRNRISKEQGGYNTVPMIFIGDEFIGGFTELASLESRGTLESKIKDGI